MAKVNDDIFKPNSDVSKKAEAEKSKVKGPKITESVVNGPVRTRREPLGRKIFDTFFSDAESADSIKSYIIFEKVIPAMKDTATDIWQSIPDFLFGTGGYSASRRSSRRSYDAYYVQPRTNAANRYSSQTVRQTARSNDMEEYLRNRRAHGSADYRDIVFESRMDAQEVLDKLIDALDQYEVVSLVDLYSAVGITSKFTDDKFGWDSLDGSRILRARGGGYTLDLPPLKAID